MGIKITQNIVDEVFYWLGGGGCYKYEVDDIRLIQNHLLNGLSINVGIGDVVRFWKWRSEQYDMGFTTPHDIQDTCKWFKEYLEADRGVDENYGED